MDLAGAKELTLPYMVRRSGVAMAMPAGGSELFRLQATVEYVPWRGLCLTAVLLGGSSLLSRFVHWPGLIGAAYGVSLVLGLGFCVSEVACRRDRLTPEGIERRSGILGRRVLLIPYRSVTLVKVERPGRRSRLDVGTVAIRADGTQHWLVAVQAPGEIEALIERCRREVGNVYAPPANPSLQRTEGSAAASALGR